MQLNYKITISNYGTSKCFQFCAKTSLTKHTKRSLIAIENLGLSGLARKRRDFVASNILVKDILKKSQCFERKCMMSTISTETFSNLTLIWFLI